MQDLYIKNDVTCLEKIIEHLNKKLTNVQWQKYLILSFQSFQIDSLIQLKHNQNIRFFLGK